MKGAFAHSMQMLYLLTACHHSQLHFTSILPQHQVHPLRFLSKMNHRAIHSLWVRLQEHSRCRRRSSSGWQWTTGTGACSRSGRGGERSAGLHVDPVRDVGRLLRGVRVLRPLVDLQVREQVVANAAAGQHAADGLLHDALWDPLLNHPQQRPSESSNLDPGRDIR